MGRRGVVDPLLALGVAALASSDDVFSLVQRAAPRADGQLEGLASTSSPGHSRSLQGLLKLIEDNLQAMESHLQSGKIGENETEGTLPRDTTQRLLREVDDVDGRPDEGCDATDQDQMSAVIVKSAEANATTAWVEECAWWNLYKRGGATNMGMMGHCMQKYFHVSSRCSNCYVNFLHEVQGKLPLKPGCTLRCFPASAICMDGPSPNCWNARADCTACSRPYLKRMLKCFGFDYDQVLMEQFDGMTEAIRAGVIQYPETLKRILMVIVWNDPADREG